MAAIHRLNLRLLKRTLRQTKPYWFSEEKASARWLLFGLLVLLLANTYTDVLFNDRSGEFTSALAEQDGPRFWRAMRDFFLILVAGVPIYAYYYYVKDRLALNWRRWLTGRFIGRYLHERGYYRLQDHEEIDNPDQRIAEDIDSFTYQTLTFLLLFANAVLQLVAFGSVLWSISVPLVGVLVLYAAFATGVTFRLFGEKLVSLHSLQRRREADFRFGLIRVRENAESIAFYHGETLEQNHLQKVFGRVFANQSEVIRWTLRLNFFYYSNSFLTMALPTLIIAPRVLSGELEVGRIVQATGAFGAILSALTLMLNNIEDLSRFAASVTRLETLVQALGHDPATVGERRYANWFRKRLPGKGWLLRVGALSGPFRRSHADLLLPAPGAAPTSQNLCTRIWFEPSSEIEFRNVTVQTPNRERTLVRGLTFRIREGESLMIAGPSGMGKSSLLRVIAGLWRNGSGEVLRPSDEDLFFLPQSPYMIAGTLRLQLNYPRAGGRATSDRELLAALEAVNLGGLRERCGGFDCEFDFDKMLSAGERQRLAFARVLLRRPRYVLLDEATSALDAENEALLYARLVELQATFISVSHHDALEQYHTHRLDLQAGGGWRIQPCARQESARYAYH